LSSWCLPKKQLKKNTTFRHHEIISKGTNAHYQTIRRENKAEEILKVKIAYNFPKSATDTKQQIQEA
jgi:hypothetical protein